MLVDKRMSHPVIWITPDMPVHEALNLFKRERIRRAPVLKDEKMVGIVSDRDLINASPSPVTSLSVYELNYLLSKITVSDVMTREVLTVKEDTPLEEAARIMADNKIGGLPVMREGHVVGIITETDLFKIFLELLGARERGVRVTAMISDKKGTLAKITKSIADLGGNFISFGLFTGEDPTNRTLTFKASGITRSQIEESLSPFILSIIDIRE
jgi:acetoin utilization protein AcuB